MHDRDVNAALNILRAGLERQPLVEEIPVLQAGEQVKYKREQSNAWSER
jgi:transposase